MGDLKWRDLGIKYSDEDLVAKFEIETESLHSFKDLYKRVFDWLFFEDYRNIQTDDLENYEILYWEKTHNAGHKEHHIWWRAYKIPVKDIGSDYFIYFFKINFQTIRVSKAEVMFKGKKWGTNDANVIIRVNAYLVINDKDWVKDDQPFSSLLKSMRPRFRAWLYKDKIWFHRKFLYDKAFELQNVIKEYLGERLTQDIPPNIYKEKGLG
jgi:hypothetical protein